MADKEYTVIEIVDVLRRQAAGDKSVQSRATGMDRKTVRKYIRIAEGKGPTKETDSRIEEIAHAVLRKVNGGNQPDDGNSRDALLLPHKSL